MQVSFIVVASITERYNIPLPMRKLGMEVKVISEDKVYNLTTLAIGASEGADAANWTLKVLSGYVQDSEVGAASGVAPLDSEGLIPAQYLGNLFVTDTFIVSDQSERLSITTSSGAIVVQQDDGSKWLKLNDDDPSGLEDFALLSAGGDVLSVNGETGVVEIDFTTLLGFGDSQNQFNTAVSLTPYAGSVNSSLTSLQSQIDAIDYYEPTEINNLLALKADKINVMPLDGSLTFIPTIENHPTNKKYVDDVIATAGLGIIIVTGELFVIDNLTDQSFNTTYAKLTQFNKAGISTGTTSSLATSAIQVSKSGYYTVTCTLSMGPLPTVPTQVVVSVFQNGVVTDVRSQHIFNDVAHTEDITLRGTLDLNIGDTVDVRVKTDNASGVAVLCSQGTFTATATVGGTGASIKDNLGSVAAPTGNDDATQGYTVGSHWIDVSNDIVYVCTDSSTGAAVWKLVSSSNYTHNQIASSATWNIAHNLNKYPSVTIVDAGNIVVVGDIEYTDLNNLVVTFTGGVTGKAYLN
jgi:hypothetical protein